MKQTVFTMIAMLACIVLGWADIVQAEEKPRPAAVIPAASIQARDFSHLIGMGGFSDTLLNNHFKLYQGYVKNTLAVLEKLNALLVGNNENTPEYAELKRRLGWEFNGMLLHEYYFENLGGKEPIDTKSTLYRQMIANFGTPADWKRDFVATGSMRGIGWVVLYLEPKTGRLVNTWINEHDVGHIAAAQPILVMDVFEHAYMTDYQLDKARYIDSFFRNINWKAPMERFNKAVRKTR